MSLVLPPGATLIGIGCDLVEVARVQGVIERQGERFLERVFTEGERAYCADKARPEPFYAGRFAAKEAVAKCFGTGIGEELGWKSISVAHGPRGEPLVVLDAQAQAFLLRVGGDRILLSISHTDTMAMAMAAVVRCPEQVCK